MTRTQCDGCLEAVGGTSASACRRWASTDQVIARAGDHHYRQVVLRWLFALVIAGIVSAFAVLLLTGRYLADGPVLLRIGPDHGVHAGDLFVVLGWAAALLAVVGLVRAPGRRDG